MHGAKVPADFCTDASEVLDRSQPQQSSAGAHRVGEVRETLVFFGVDVDAARVHCVTF